MKKLDNDNDVKNFLTFLEEMRVEGEGVEYTHTAFGAPWGKYNVSDENMGKFINLYKKALNAYINHGIDENSSEWKLHITEKPKRVGQLVLDLDFRVNNKDRKYLEGHIDYIVGKVNTTIKKYVRTADKNIEAFVFEKEHPTYDNKQDNYKDGIHIMYPHIAIDASLRYKIIESLQNEIEREGTLDDIGFINKYDDVFDKSIVLRNGWMMYGSRKYNGQKYNLTHIYNDKGIETKHDIYSHDELVAMLYVRQYNAEDVMPLKDEYNNDKFNKELVDIYQKYHPDKQKKKKTILIDLDENTGNNDNDNIKPTVSASASASISTIPTNDKTKNYNRNIDMAKKLTKILSKQRATSYKSWIIVGWALHNTDESLLQDFIEFSKKAPEQYVPGCCERVWEKARDLTNEGFTLSSIYWWAKEDNPTEYANIMRDSLNEFIDRAKTGSHDDIAKVVFELYKHSYRCASITKNVWYEFQGHRWVRVDSGYTLANKLSDEVTNEFAQLAGTYFVALTGKQGQERDTCLNTGKDILKIVEKLKNQGFKNSVLESCAARFYDKKFEEKLDDNPYLIGFENGVYDLQNLCFRKGTPDDYLTLSTGYDYKEYDRNDKDIRDINEFFNKVMREEDMRTYILTLLSSYLDGKCKDQSFILWTGSGCHAAGTPIMMYNGTTKLVEDIKLNDYLMGDDSNPRKVKTLYKGEQDMYNITLDDGRSFKVNANHRLAIKCLFRPYISTEQSLLDNTIYRVNYHVIKEHIPMTESQTFETLHDAETFIGKITSEYEIIKYNDVISIQVIHYIDFMKMHNSVHNYYKMFNNPIEYTNEIYPVPNADGQWYLNNWSEEKIEFAPFEVHELILKYWTTKYGTTIDKTIMENNKLFKHIVYSQGMKISETDKTYQIINDNTYSFSIEKSDREMFYGFELDGNHRFVMGNYIVTMNSNGKSTVVNLMSYTLGEYFDTLPTSILTKKRGDSSSATPELANKRGKRFLVIQEPEHDDVIYVGNMKQLTGADWIEARALYGDPFRYKPQFKLILTCNKLPHIPSHDGGTWRRLRVSPWESEFIDGVPKLPHQFPKDRELDDKLKKWKSAFVWFLINDYYPSYSKIGIKEPDKIRQYTDKYKKDTDTYYEFLRDTMIITKDDADIESVCSIYTIFKSWYLEGYSMRAPPRKDFNNYLTDAGYKISNGMVKGIRFQNGEDRARNAAAAAKAEKDENDD